MRWACPSSRRARRQRGALAGHIRERGEGLHHVALRTDDVESLVASLREWDVPLEDAQPRDGFTGRLSFLAPEAMDGALLELVQPAPELLGGDPPVSAVTRIDHVVLRLPDVEEVCRRMVYYFGVETKRTFERGETRFSFLRPGDVVRELVGRWVLGRLRPHGPASSPGWRSS